MTGQGWPQLGELTLAFALSALVGLEREIRQKSAGSRTSTPAGVASALFMLISKHGFTDVLAAGRSVVDHSRVAAQVVSGIGFIGGGVIFMRRDLVRGLTTAASPWPTAALGMACGAGLPVLAAATAIAQAGRDRGRTRGRHRRGRCRAGLGLRPDRPRQGVMWRTDLFEQPVDETLRFLRRIAV